MVGQHEYAIFRVIESRLGGCDLTISFGLACKNYVKMSCFSLRTYMILHECLIIFPSPKIHNFVLLPKFSISFFSLKYPISSSKARNGFLQYLLALNCTYGDSNYWSSKKPDNQNTYQLRWFFFPHKLGSFSRSMAAMEVTLQWQQCWRRNYSHCCSNKIPKTKRLDKKEIGREHEKWKREAPAGGAPLIQVASRQSR